MPVLSLLQYRCYDGLLPAVWKFPRVPRLVEGVQEFPPLVAAQMLDHSICDTIFSMGLLVLQSPDGAVQVMDGKVSCHASRWCLLP